MLSSLLIGIVVIILSLGAVVLGNAKKLTWLTVAGSMVGIFALFFFVVPVLLKIGFYAVLIAVACYIAFLIYSGLSREPS